MKNTLTWKRAVVLIELERLCPNIGDEHEMSANTKLIHVIIGKDWPQWEIRSYNGGTCLWERAFAVSPYSDENNADFGFMYALFGLSERDAVEAERAKYAKLVEALEKIATAHEDGGRRINGHHALGIKELSFKMMECAQAALDDYKKGGAGE